MHFPIKVKALYINSPCYITPPCDQVCPKCQLCRGYLQQGPGALIELSGGIEGTQLLGIDGRSPLFNVAIERLAYSDISDDSEVDVSGN